MRKPSSNFQSKKMFKTYFGLLAVRLLDCGMNFKNLLFHNNRRFFFNTFFLPVHILSCALVYQFFYNFMQNMVQNSITYRTLTSLRLKIKLEVQVFHLWKDILSKAIYEMKPHWLSVRKKYVANKKACFCLQFGISGVTWSVRNFHSNFVQNFSVRCKNAWTEKGH